ncbi:hypothetical protein WA026_021327 [Henosepilachna vigintioctopunctata]|uniref:Uncharacterized protein n=1 Tax=Henosepilachna vigintioctopunctata TaxID=420089 RepID=A0AAW1UDW9_9CUCU
MDNITQQISEIIKTWDTQRMNQAKEALQFLKSLEDKEKKDSDNESSDMEVTVEETPRHLNRKRQATKTPPPGTFTEPARRRKTSEAGILPTATSNKFEALQNLDDTDLPSPPKDEKKERSPPPIVLWNKSKWTDISRKISNARLSFTEAKNIKDGIGINPVEYHTHALPEKTPEGGAEKSPLRDATRGYPGRPEKPEPSCQDATEKARSSVEIQAEITPSEKSSTSGLNYTQALKGKTAQKSSPAVPKTSPKPVERRGIPDPTNFGKMFEMFSTFNIEKFKAVLQKMCTVLTNTTTLPEIMIGIFQCIPDICAIFSP